MSACDESNLNVNSLGSGRRANAEGSEGGNFDGHHSDSAIGVPAAARMFLEPSKVKK